MWCNAAGLVLASILMTAAMAAGAEERPIMAVFGVEVKGTKLDPGTVDRLTDYLGSLVAARGFQVIPRSQLRDRLRQEKEVSYQQCYDQSCQIEIGKELAAQKSLATQVLKIGKKCKVTLTLFDLRRAASDNAATASGGCGEDEVVEALEKAVGELLGHGGSASPGQVAALEKPSPAEKQPQVQAPVPRPVPVSTGGSAGAYDFDSDTVLLDHFEGATSATLQAYTETNAACGPAKPAASPAASYLTGPAGLGKALELSPPAGQPDGSASYLRYGGGQLLSSPNGTIELRVYLTSYASGISLVDQGPFYGSCAGWTFGMGISQTGQLTAGAWEAFNMNSGSAKVPLHTWVHLAVSFGSAGAKLYIDGIQVGNDPSTGRPAPGFSGSLLVRAGTHAGITARIDELRVSNVQRTTFR